jgi:hypothetical protein
MSAELTRITPEQLEAASRALIKARTTNLGIEIEMPIMYPNGQCVSVVVTVRGGDYVVHDAGFGAMYLTAAGVTMTKNLTERLSRLADAYGCDFVSGRMSRSCTQEQLAIAIALVANASRAVGDQALEIRRQRIRDFKREVSVVLNDVMHSERVKRDRVIGDSGTEYQVDFVVLGNDKERPLAFVEPVSDQDAVNTKFREFFDIQSNRVYQSVDRIAVYDDRHTWRPGDLLVLNRVSNVVPFTAFPRRLKRLAA